MATVIKARDSFPNGFSVFLAGSVAGNDWRQDLVKLLKEKDIIFLDPRSDDYDSIKTSISDPLFVEQVTWEQDGLEHADVVVMFFNRNSESPITLMEFGLFARTKKVIVRCPKGYKHKGYVDVISERFALQQVDTIEEIADLILDQLK